LDVQDRSLSDQSATFGINRKFIKFIYLIQGLFDLNSDGTPEAVPWLQSGSGFLALGEVSRSGLYLKEDGSVGFAQQINLTA